MWHLRQFLILAPPQQVKSPKLRQDERFIPAWVIIKIDKNKLSWFVTSANNISHYDDNLQIRLVSTHTNTHIKINRIKLSLRRATTVPLSNFNFKMFDVYLPLTNLLTLSNFDPNWNETRCHKSFDHCYAVSWVRPYNSTIKLLDNQLSLISTSSLL